MKANSISDSLACALSKTRPFMTLLIVIIIAVALLAGCGRSVKLGNEDIKAIWRLYYAQEFTDGLEESLSSEQRKAIIQDIAERNRLDYAQIMAQLKKSDPERFEKLFY